MTANAVLVVGMSALLSSWFTNQGVHSSWYQSVKPTWTPPPRAFTIIWTMLYASLAYSLSKTTMPAIHYIHLLCGALWCWQFFVLEQACLSVATCVVIFISAVVLCIGHPCVRWYLVPLVLWCGLALYMNVCSCHRR